MNSKERMDLTTELYDYFSHDDWIDTATDEDLWTTWLAFNKEGADYDDEAQPTRQEYREMIAQVRAWRVRDKKEEAR